MRNGCASPIEAPSQACVGIEAPSLTMMGDFSTLSNTFSSPLSSYELADKGLLRNRNDGLSQVCSQNPGYVLSMFSMSQVCS